VADSYLDIRSMSVQLDHAFPANELFFLPFHGNSSELEDEDVVREELQLDVFHQFHDVSVAKNKQTKFSSKIIESNDHTCIAKELNVRFSPYCLSSYRPP